MLDYTAPHVFEFKLNFMLIYYFVNILLNLSCLVTCRYKRKNQTKAYCREFREINIHPILLQVCFEFRNQRVIVILITDWFKLLYPLRKLLSANRVPSEIYPYLLSARGRRREENPTHVCFPDRHKPQGETTPAGSTTPRFSSQRSTEQALPPRQNTRHLFSRLEVMLMDYSVMIRMAHFWSLV